jgi:sugar phosphate isomerase/epimerase
MAILTHGSDLSLAPTLGPLVQEAAHGDGTVRGALERLSAAGFSAVQLDAALPGIRPRELSTRARRDLSALLARQELRLAGIDLFIPRRHYLQPDLMDRALTATTAAIELAADLGRVPLSLALPIAAMTQDAHDALAACADGHGVPLAIHAEDDLDALLAWMARMDQPVLGAGLDPCAVLGCGHDPGAFAQRLGARLLVARLNDLIGAPQAPTPSGPTAAGVRCTVGQGDLDLTAYRVAIDLAGRRTGPVVLDLRGLPDPLAAASAAHHAWDHAAFTL